MPTSITEKFLLAVLPPEGVYCAFVLQTKRNHFFKTIAELASFILAQDAQGLTVYHACSSYKDGSSRTAANIHCVRALWLDVDAGIGKPYSTAADAWRACELFNKSCGLPPPLYVSSGTGLHVYWPLQERRTLEQWQRLATGLKSLCQQHGLLAGPERTADAASILRSPGTFHRKNPNNPRLVEVGEIVGPYDCSNFKFLFDGNNILHLGNDSLSPTRFGSDGAGNKTPLRSSLSALAQACIAEQEFPLGNAEIIVEECAQLKYMRDTGGQMQEPEWKACLNVLAFCQDGRDYAHEWSQGDERYDPAETDRKFERGTALSGPTTCAHFNGLNDRCKGCPHQNIVSTPCGISARRPVVDRGSPAIPASDGKTEPDGSNLPDTFEWIDGALFHRQGNKKEDVDVKICNNKLCIERMNHSEGRSDSFSIILKHKPPHDEWQSVEMPLKVLFGASGMSEVMGKGIIIHENDLFKKFVRESIDKLNGIGKASVQYEQFGWKDHDTTFLVGQQLYCPDRIVPVAGTPEIIRRTRELGPRTRGSLEKWKEAADTLFAQGVEAQGFALLASFAAPLMRFHSQDEGGAIVSLVSRDSGKGKTTALTAAASVWGQFNALRLTNVDTKVSKGITLGVICNLPVIYDELSNRDPEVVKEFVQIVTNGRDKARGTADGHLVHVDNDWQTILISGSNTSTVETICAAKGSEAMAMRIIEFQVSLPPHIKHQEGDKLKNQLLENAGWAGDAYMRRLVQPETLAWVKMMLPKIREEIAQKQHFTSEHRFWARTLSSIAVASVIIKDLGLVSFSPDRILEWATEELIEQARNPRTFSATSLLAEFLANNIDATLIMQHSWRPGKARSMVHKVPIKSLKIRHEIEDGRIIVDEKEFRNWIVKEGASWQHVLVELKDKEVLIDAKRQVTLGADTDLAVGQRTCLILNSMHPLVSGQLKVVQEIAKGKTA